jgi:flagellar protein FliO/FliZ
MAIVNSSGIKYGAGALIFFFLLFALCPISAQTRKKIDKQYARERVTRNSDPAGQEESRKPVKNEITSENQKDGGEKKVPGDVGLYDEYNAPRAEEESYVWLIFKTIFVIGVLVGGFYYFFRFVTKKVGIQVLGKDVVQILSIVPLGQNKFLQVVDLAGRVMVLGISDTSINLITEIKDKDEINRIRLLSSKSTPVEQEGFHEFIVKQIGKLADLTKKRRRGTGAGVYESRQDLSESDRLDYLKKQKERLKKLNGQDDEK